MPDTIPGLKYREGVHRAGPGRLPFLIRLLHWPLAITLPLMIFTGLGLHAMARPEWSLFPAYPAWLPTCRMLMWHRIIAIIFTASLVPTLVVYLRTWIRTRRWFRGRVPHLPLLGGGAVSAFTGLMLLNVCGGAGIQTAARFIHAAFGLAILPLVFILHGITAVTVYRRLLAPAFSVVRGARPLQLLWVAAALVFAAAAILNDVPAAIGDGDTLLAARIEPPGDTPPDTLPWDRARSLHVSLSNGLGYAGGVTDVRLRALHDGKNIYVEAQWDDPAPDRRYHPWERTAGGWKHLKTSVDDPNVYYEDKFAMVFPVEKCPVFDHLGCAASCHAGGGTPYGIKNTPTVIDVWHWKATRTDPVGQVDDKYWDDDPAGARHGDPKDGGGYTKNNNDDETAPRFLPANPGAVLKGGILADGAVPLTPGRAAAIAPGTIVPGIVTAPARGDRGDVRCRSRHEHGRWWLWISRPLDTGSDRDCAMKPGGTYSFGCAAFNHTSNRHAYNHDTQLLRLEK